MKRFLYMLVTILTIPNACQPDADLKTIIKTVGLAYGISLGSTVSHELGHALAAKVLWNSPIDITIGASPTDNITSKPLFNFFGVKIQSLILGKGAFSRTTYATPVRAENYLAMVIAGPLASCAFLTGAALAINKRSDHPDKISTIIGGTSLLMILLNTIDAVFDTHGTSDGAKIYNTCRFLAAQK